MPDGMGAWLSANHSPNATTETMRAPIPHFKSAGRLRFLSGSVSGWTGSALKSAAVG